MPVRCSSRRPSTPIPIRTSPRSCSGDGSPGRASASCTGSTVGGGPLVGPPGRGAPCRTADGDGGPPMTERWDMAVVGAGPAGSAAALGAPDADPDLRVLDPRPVRFPAGQGLRGRRLPPRPRRPGRRGRARPARRSRAGAAVAAAVCRHRRCHATWRDRLSWCPARCSTAGCSSRRWHRLRHSGVTGFGRYARSPSALCSTTPSGPPRWSARTAPIPRSARHCGPRRGHPVPWPCVAHARSCRPTAVSR